MLYLKKFESHNEVFDLREELGVVSLPIKDMGYDVNIYSHIDTIEKLNMVGIVIRSTPLIEINKEFISYIIEIVNFMKFNDYVYEAEYHTWHSLPKKFNIYNHGLKAGGRTMDENYPNSHKIRIDFYQKF